MTAIEAGAMFQDVLRKNRLANLSQFHRADLFEEMPLYTRESDIDFLIEHDTESKNKLLLSFAVQFLNSVIAYKEHAKPFFAAVSVWNFSVDDPFVPNLFVWTRPLQELHEVLTLCEAKSAFSKRIKKSLSNSAKTLTVLEDATTTSDLERVFIGPSEAPNPNFVVLDALMNSLVAR